MEVELTGHDASPTSVREIDDLSRAHAAQRGALLPLLHDIQHRIGHVPADAVPIIADALNLSRAEVHGVITFYRDFRSIPADGRVVKLCRAEACQARGGDVVAAALDRSGVKHEPGILPRSVRDRAIGARRWRAGRTGQGCS